MPFSFRKLTKLQFIAFGLIALLGLSAGAFSWSDWVSKTPGKPAVAGAAAQTGPPEVYSGLLVQELLTLRPTGFDPAEITIPGGNFLLSVDNLSGVATINLALAEEKKDKLKDIKMVQHSSKPRTRRGRTALMSVGIRSAMPANQLTIRV